ncbi:unnamed protein product [Rotaria sp. Silwood2]|nr:unnamed protein product [Rotaria sp. Silwood2]CAF4326607.1 unnamed protein product [Rotaria sp. Silwood2]
MPSMLRLSSCDVRFMVWCLILIMLLGLGFRHFSHPLLRHSSLSGILPLGPQQAVTPQLVTESPLIRLYLDVVRDTVCGLSLRTQEGTIDSDTKNKRPVRVHERVAGRDRPLIGITMIGQRRLDNIEWALRRVISNKIPGDFIECGVWRGGASVYARAVLKALEVTDRHVWVVDSFQGLPKARTNNDDNSWYKMEYLKVRVLKSATTCTLLSQFIALGISGRSSNQFFCVRSPR